MREIPIFRAFALLAALVAVQSLAQAQAKDPFTLDPADRPSASLPLPYGIIASLDYPAYSVALDENDVEELDQRPGFSFAAYIDAWQLAFARRFYGDVVQISMRNVGRDVWSGPSFVYGWEVTQQQVRYDQNGNSVVVDTTFAAPYYGLGYRYESGLKSSLSLLYRLAMDFGVRDFDNGVSVLYGLNAGAGARIPIGTTALSILAFGEMFNYGGDYGVGGLFAFGLSASAALNLQAE